MALNSFVVKLSDAIIPAIFTVITCLDTKYTFSGIISKANFSKLNRMKNEKNVAATGRLANLNC